MKAKSPHQPRSQEKKRGGGSQAQPAAIDAGENCRRDAGAPTAAAKAGAERAGRVIVALLLLCAIYLAFKGLDGAAFWDDEADVGIISRNWLATGEFSGWDGRNLYAQRNGTVLDKNLHIINPPLMYWMCAASFKAFGATTWAGRFPFALAGLLALAAFALLLRHDFAPDGWLWLYALGGLGLSPVYLLYIRQCRYFAPCILFAVLIFFGYRRFLEGRRRRDLALLAGAAILMFYAHYLMCASFLLALGTVHLVYHRRDFSRRDWGAATLAGAAFLAATLPHALMARIWDRPDHPAPAAHALQLRLVQIGMYFRDLNRMGALPWTLALGILLLWLLRRRRDPALRRGGEWGLLALANVFFNALLSPLVPQAVNSDVRYLVASLPFFAALAGLFLIWLHRRSRAAALAVFVLLLATRLLGFPPHMLAWSPWLLPDYVREIHRPYPTGFSEAARFLREHARQDDVVLADPFYANYPLLFYAGDKVRFGCLLDPESPLVPAVTDRLNAPLRSDHNFPNWFISFGLREQTGQILNYFSRPHLERGRTVQYTYQPAQLLDVYCDGGNRPELFMHLFGPFTGYNHQSEAVYIYRRQELP